MVSNTPTERLSRIETHWSMLFQAHTGPVPEAQAACRALMARYGGAAYRYLLGAVRDADVADDLTQEFALRFLRGDFQRADPERGRFRDYLKTALIHLVRDYWRARQRWPGAMGHEPAAPDVPAPDPERGFLHVWRQELLAKTWNALAELNPAAHTALRLRVHNPEMPSAQLAERLAAQLGKPVNAAWVRKTLQRAHHRFAALLLDEVARSLPAATPQGLRRELENLDLLRYCRTALERWRV
jgi:RNA polymerase sigma-70 factor (ECF subfamily)